MQVYSEEEKIEEFSRKKSSTKNLIKFYLMPGWRNPEFSAREYQIEKIKSKRRLFRRLLTPLTLVGFLMVLIVAFIAVYAPWLTELTLENVTPPLYPGEAAFQPPSPEHPLGTTQYGWDILGRLLWGARTTLQAAVFPVAISIGGGILFGTISGYFGGWVDTIIMRVCDIFLSLPMLIIVIVLAPLVGKNLYSVLGIYGVLFIPFNIRFMRSLVLQVKQNDYVRAAISSGGDKFRVMFKHIFPNTISPIIISFFGAMGITVIGLAGLAFIGLGDPRVANWGADIMYAQGHFNTPGASLWPGLFIGITAIGCILIGDGLRDALDPRLHI
ncbi:MAG: ABC transporter permease [Candidatus Lokiarchaeota archaeon]|nr:ABC transporter permease [Candidatus Lokiarchaeota archaeon]